MTSPTPPNLARIPAGDFLMGAADAEEDERPVHRVYVSEFFIGRFPVTHDEYARFVRATGHPAAGIRDLPLIAAGGREPLFRELAAPYVWDGDQPPPGHGSHPVVLVRYDDALAYCRWLSDDARARRAAADRSRMGEGRARRRRRPAVSVGQRHRSARAPTSCPTRRPSGSAARGPPAPIRRTRTGSTTCAATCGSGCRDWYGADYYGLGEMRDPRGPASGNMRIVRGGSWVNDDVSMLRCAYRHKVPPDTYAYSVGFRIVCAP